VSFLPSRSDIYIKKRKDHLILDEIERRRVGTTRLDKQMSGKKITGGSFCGIFFWLCSATAGQARKVAKPKYTSVKPRMFTY